MGMVKLPNLANYTVFPKKVKLEITTKTATVDSLDVDKGWAWMALFASFLGLFVTGGICFSMGAYLPTYAKIYDPVYGAILTSLPGSLILIFAMISQWSATYIGFSKTFLLGTVIGSLGFFLAAFSSRHVFAMIVTQGIMVGIGSGLIFTPAISVNKVCFDRKHMLANAIAMSGTALGVLIFPFIISATLNKYGIPGSMIFMGAIFLIALVSVVILIRIPSLSVIKKQEMYKKRNSTNLNQITHQVDAEPTTQNLKSEDVLYHTIPLSKRFEQYALKGRRFFMFIVCVTAWQMASNVIYFTITDFGKKSGLSDYQSASLVSWIGIGDLSGRLLILFWGIYETKKSGPPRSPENPEKSSQDENGKSEMVKYVLKLVSYGSTILFHVGVCLLYLYQPRNSGILIYLITALSAWFGILFGMRITLTPILLSKMFGQIKFHTAYGIIIMIGGFGSIVGTPLSTYLAKHFNNPFVVFYFTAISFLISLIFFGLTLM